MVEYAFPAPIATATIKDSAAGTIPIGLLKDVELGVEFDLKDLYGGGSILRQAVFRCNAKVPVTIKRGKFDGAFMLAVTGEDGTPATSGNGITDSISPELFDIEVTLTAVEDDTKTIKVKAEEIAISTFKVAIDTNGDWVLTDMTGTGKDLVVTQGLV